jgi:hypothetical protein
MGIEPVSFRLDRGQGRREAGDDQQAAGHHPAGSPSQDAAGMNTAMLTW